MDQDELLDRDLVRAGIDYRKCSPEEWLNLALQAEGYARQMGALDPAYGRLAGDQRLYEKAAALAERRGQATA